MVAISGDTIVVGANRDAALGTNAGSASVFTNVADGTLNDARFRVPTRKWVEHWTNRDDKPWQLKTMDLDGHSHMSAPPASFREGMRWLFSTE